MASVPRCTSTAREDTFLNCSPVCFCDSPRCLSDRSVIGFVCVCQTPAQGRKKELLERLAARTQPSSPSDAAPVAVELGRTHRLRKPPASFVPEPEKKKRKVFLSCVAQICVRFLTSFITAGHVS